MRALFLCVTRQHDIALVALAALICCVGVGSGFALGREALRSRARRARVAWAAGGVIALSSAIWATHFIAMLAYDPGVPFRFDVVRTASSYLVAVWLVGTGVALIASTPGRGPRVVGGVIVGVAISAMHYTGMSAYQTQGHIRWDVGVVVASVACGAVFAGLSALASASNRRWVRLCGPAMFVLAVCLDHFLGMSAVTIEYDPTAPVPSGVVNAALLVVLVTGVTFLIVGLALAALWLTLRDRRHLAREERHLRDLADIAVEGLLICRGESIVGANRSLARMLACAGEDLIGHNLGDLFPGLKTDEVPTAREADASLARGAAAAIPVRIIGKEIVIGGRTHQVVAVRDQRDRLRNEAQMMRLAHQDSLTGLANRLSFTETLASRFLHPVEAAAGFALLMLDLDRFKPVNDSLGHGIGDELLRRVANRLRKAIPEGHVAGRLGGDEFAVLAPLGADTSPLRRLAETIIDLVSRPFLIDGHVIEITTSIGIALAPSDGQEPIELSRSADLALYRAKDEGRSTYQFFEPEMNARAQARRLLELDLRRAASRSEFEVHYQPQVDPKTGAYQGAEALIRWRHPQRGMVSPADFIPIAEEVGLIGSIGEWVLRTACAEAVGWPDHLSVSVNLSPVQFRDPRLLTTVGSILSETGLPGTRLELEVTENALLHDDGSALATLNALRALGIRMSMDDFGTGYSSLSYLRRFPFDKIKIDQSFIRTIPADPDSIAIVQAITSLGAKLKMTVTAEGVETAEQHAFTVREGCDQIQGYLISRPVASAELRALLAGSFVSRPAA